MNIVSFGGGTNSAAFSLSRNLAYASSISRVSCV